LGGRRADGRWHLGRTSSAAQTTEITLSWVKQDDKLTLSQTTEALAVGPKAETSTAQTLTVQAFRVEALTVGALRVHSLRVEPLRAEPLRVKSLVRFSQHTARHGIDQTICSAATEM
jgi:hypothetical protein